MFHFWWNAPAHVKQRLHTAKHRHASLMGTYGTLNIIDADIEHVTVYPH